MARRRRAGMTAAMVRQMRYRFVVLALLAWSGPALAQAQKGPRIPNSNDLTILVRTTVIALNQANRTGNYTVFRDLGSANFRSANTPARLGEIFATLRKRNLNLAGIVLFNPQYKTKTIIDKTGMLRMAGKFPTAPFSVHFDLAYQWAGGRWRLFGIWVDTKSATAATPAAQKTSGFKTTTRSGKKRKN